MVETVQCKPIEVHVGERGLERAVKHLKRTFPLILPGIGACLILSFISSFDEFIYALFLGGNDVTLPVFMWTQVRFPQTLPTILALGSCIFLGSATLILTAEWLRRMGTSQTKNTS